jgi:hypothetical protein
MGARRHLEALNNDGAAAGGASRVIVVNYPDKEAWISQLLARRDLTGANKVTGVALACHLNMKTGQLNPSMLTIAAETSQAARTVQGHIAFLKEAGLIDWTGTKGATSNWYRLLLQLPSSLVPQDTARGDAALVGATTHDDAGLRQDTARGDAALVGATTHDDAGLRQDTARGDAALVGATTHDDAGNPAQPQHTPRTALRTNLLNHEENLSRAREKKIASDCSDRSRANLSALPDDLRANLISGKFSEAEIRAWFESCEFVFDENQNLLVKAPSLFHRNWVADNFTARLAAALKARSCTVEVLQGAQAAA